MRKLLIIAFIIFLTTVCHGQEVQVVSEEYVPYQYWDDEHQATGFGIELVSGVFKAAGIPLKGGRIDLLPWQRAYRMALNTDNAAVFMTVRNDQRENLFKWVGPLAPRTMWLYKLSSRKDIQITTLEEAKTYTVGGYQSAQTDYLIELGFTNLEIVSHERLNIGKLLAGRIDLVPYQEQAIKQRLRDRGLGYDVVEKVVLFDDRFDYYLALNPHIADALVSRLQVALDEIKQNGAYEVLRKKYLE